MDFLLVKDGNPVSLFEAKLGVGRISGPGRYFAARLLRIKPHTFRKRAKEKFGL